MAIIFVPGIKASELVDVYPLEHETRWSLEDLVAGNIFEDALDIELLAGHYDKDVDRLFKPGRLINHAYGRLVERLRRDVEPQVYTFPYDWRKSIAVSARHLSDFIDHVQGKMAALGRSPIVGLVTHSMGGLVARSALSLRRPRPFDGIGRVLFIAPPFQGSCEIPKVLIAGQRSGFFSREEDFRKLARGFPSVYELIPSFEGSTLDAGTGGTLDLFVLGNWQGNLVQKGKLSNQFLINGEAHRRGTRSGLGGACPAPLLSDAQLRTHADHTAVIQSVGHSTVRTIRIEPANPRNPNWFDFDWAESNGSDEYGDERVHLRSSATRGITLGCYRGIRSHGLVCRESVPNVIRPVSLRSS